MTYWSRIENLFLTTMAKCFWERFRGLVDNRLFSPEYDKLRPLRNVNFYSFFVV